jgi:hypothetical protein
MYEFALKTIELFTNKNTAANIAKSALIIV